MAYQAVPRGIKVELNALQNLVPVVNIHYVQMGTAVTDTDLESVADAVAVWYDENGRNLHHTSYVLQNITCTDVSVEAGHQFILTSIANPAGTVTGTAAAANAAAAISWRTANTGRSYRGRTYIGGLAAANLSNAQTLDSTMVTALGTAAAALIDDLEAIGATLVIVSRFAAGVARVIAVATEVINIIIDAKVDSQRRRTAN